MPTEYSRTPNFTTESTKAFSYSVVPTTEGDVSKGGSQSGVGPAGSASGGSPAQDFNPTDHKTERVDYSQKAMGSSGGKGDFAPANVDKYNVLP